MHLSVKKTSETNVSVEKCLIIFRRPLRVLIDQMFSELKSRFLCYKSYVLHSGYHDDTKLNDKMIPPKIRYE